MSIVKFEFSYDTVSGEFSVVNTETGEAKVNKIAKKSKALIDGTEPKLVLDDNKYCLNIAAKKLLGIEPDDKLDIKYEKRGNKTIPVIASDEVFGTHNGNRVTKTLTVSFRGTKHDELAKYGTNFIIVPHENKDGIFILKNEKSNDEESNNEINDFESGPEEIIEIDLQGLIDDPDITEIDSSIFKL